MPFDGSGNYSRVHDWTTDRDNNVKIQASRMDEEFDDIASSLNSVFFRNGLVPMTGDLDMGANDISDIAAGTAAAPSFSFFGDPNSGLYLAGVNSLGFATNGIKRVGITNAGLDITGALTVTGTITRSGATVWDSANDGAGSGLDADLLDGVQGSGYALLSGATFTGAVNTTAGLVSGALTGGNAPGTGFLADAAVSGVFRAANNVVGNSATVIIDNGNSGGQVYLQSELAASGFSNFVVRVRDAIGLTERLRITNAGVVTTAGNTVWHAGNDGAGSGLDADLLDGAQGSAYALLAGATFTGPVSAQKLTSTGAAEALRMADATPFISYYNNAQTTRFGYFQHDGTNFQLANEVSGGNFSIATTGAGVFTFNAAVVWHAGNDGAGSGLDADLLDGVQGSGYALLSGAPIFAGSVTANSFSTTSSSDAGADRVRFVIPYAGDSFEIGRTGPTWPTLFGWWDADRNFIYTGGQLRIGGASGYAGIDQSGAIVSNGNTVWHAGNDGAGSGLDADLLDGLNSTAFAQLAASTPTFTGQNVYITGIPSATNGLRLHHNATDGYIDYSGSLNFRTGPGSAIATLNTTGLSIAGTTITAGGNTVWHAANDGAGSGLDADLLDGIESRTIRGIERSTAAIDTSLVGKCKAISAGVTVPASTFAAGDSFALYNDSAAAVTITQDTGLTQRLNGTTTTGNRTLAARGFATIWFNSTTECVISGAVT